MQFNAQQHSRNFLSLSRLYWGKSVIEIAQARWLPLFLVPRGLYSERLCVRDMPSSSFLHSRLDQFSKKETTYQIFIANSCANIASRIYIHDDGKLM